MANDRLIYLPLGGAGEIGMNTYVYGWGQPGKERLIVVDLGVTFPDMDGSPGVDLIMADVAWLEARKDRIDGIFITHGHEDHLGALALLWPRLRAPVYVRPFTALLGQGKLDEDGIADRVLQVVQPWPHQVQAGPFKVAFLPISHSIPESAGLVIDTPAGRLLHSGDFKIDRTPVVGERFDDALWSSVAVDGVRALMCDSTNVFSTHEGRSEATLAPAMEELMRDASGMVVATTFASNVARLATIAHAAKAAGRSVCLLGRAMRRMVETAQQAGLLTDFPKTIAPEEAVELPRQNLLLLVTGSQGERRAATAQLAQGSFLGLSLKEGDTFLFSSRTIPGNERGVIRIWNQLSEKGVRVIDDDNGRYHVSGHANRPDLAFLHKLTKPQVVVPMHGEHRHLTAHVALARENGFDGVVATNGMMIDLTAGKPKVAEYVETGRTYLDGSVMIGAMDGVVRDRIRMALNGHVLVTLIIDENDDPLGDPWCESMGLPGTGKSNAALTDVLEGDLGQFMGRAGRKLILDEDKLEKEIVRIVKQTAQSEIGKKPEVTVVVSRLS